MPCKAIEDVMPENAFPAEDVAELPSVGYISTDAAKRKRKRKPTGQTEASFGDMPEETEEEKGSLTLMFENAGMTPDTAVSADVQETLSYMESADSAANIESPAEKEIYIPMGSEYVRSDELPAQDDGGEFYRMSGIVYEVAEELYRRERTQSEIEALCEPPFHRIFESGMAERLDREAEERTRLLLSHTDNAPVTEPPQSPEPVAGPPEKHLSTAKALLIELLFIIPAVNVIAAIVLSFVPLPDRSVRSFARGYVILLSVFLTAALGYFVFSYFSNPNNDAFFIRVMSLFG